MYYGDDAGDVDDDVERGEHGPCLVSCDGADGHLEHIERLHERTFSGVLSVAM